MTVTGFTGFEGQDDPVDGISGLRTGTTSINTSTVRTGAASLRCNPASSANGYVTPSYVVTGTYIHFGLNVATLPSLDRAVCGSGTAGGNLSVRLTPAGELAVYTGGALMGTSSAAFATAGWHWVGVREVTGTSVVFLQIDGVDAVTGTATVSGSFVGGIGFSGNEASAVDAYIDDIVVDDTGFLAPSKVNLLVPISDNARATLWTGGVGGTTNLFDAVNNKPPIGTATETDLTQIEHAGGAAGTTDAYDANMTTYSTAGVASGDTMLGIDFLIAHGEDIATGTKLLNFSLVSNPTQATGLADFAAGANVGALGTYPSNWTVTRNTLITNPSVTVGTSPVMRVVRPETASRVASVCFMGMHIAWTPAAAKAPPFRHNKRGLIVR